MNDSEIIINKVFIDYLKSKKGHDALAKAMISNFNHKKIKYICC